MKGFDLEIIAKLQSDLVSQLDSLIRAMVSRDLNFFFFKHLIEIYNILKEPETCLMV